MQPQKGYRQPAMDYPQPRHRTPLDRDHLRRMALGNLALEHEVLGLFSEQASRILDALAARPADENALVHTLKGSARAIGAFDVADHAAALEAVLRTGEEPAEALGRLREAVAEARVAIEAILKDPQ
jgi:HPt (histidine-containing phosphotransfer) domain-containing protein